MYGSACVCMRTVKESGSLAVFKKEYYVVTAETNDSDYIYIHIFKSLLKARHLTGYSECISV
jgi:hypothetical protein